MRRSKAGIVHVLRSSLFPCLLIGHCWSPWKEISAPEFLERRGAQFGIANGVLDRAVTEPRLNSPRVIPRIGERIAAGMSQHVDVHRERQTGALGYGLHKQVDGIRGERSAALRRKHIPTELAL